MHESTKRESIKKMGKKGLCLISLGPSAILPCPHKMGAITLRGRDFCGSYLIWSRRQFKKQLFNIKKKHFFLATFVCFQFSAADGICSPRHPAHLTLITPPPQQPHKTQLVAMVQTEFCLVFSKHMFLITTKIFYFNFPFHTQQ